MADFKSLGLPKQVVTRLEKMGLTTPTPIQEGAIPVALEGRDVMGLAQTGTGKTLAFGLPLIAQMLSYDERPARRTVRGLVLAPTRELAGQIAASLRAQVEDTQFKVGLVVGGVGINPQIARLDKGTDILVATPGRLIDLMERKAMDLGSTDFLVLDEADQMLDLGFIHALRKIAQWLPEKRQTMLFSATMPKQMSEIANTYLDDPIKVQVNPPGKAADKIEQSIHFIAKSEKTALLIELLGKHRDEAAIVFGRTKHGSERLMKALVRAGFEATSVHGNKSQGQRERAIKAFRSGEIKVLVATDVAARGLDIPQVRHVYNFDLPNVPENYVHRIGRTARAGMDGAAIAFCAPDEVDELKAIQKVMKIDIPVASGRPWEGAEIKPGVKPSGGRRRGGPARGKGGGGGGSGGGAGGGNAGGGHRGGGKPGGRPGGKPGGGHPGGGNSGGGKPGGNRRGGRRGPSK
ncbi:ATP-dependent RNA helicase RhlE [Shimia sp. SK013]|uniref:DEAD/DEAH box helicase n=1 Tax=Shimia sp. SK013 TaxID=1389006 RepID=UPI0006B489B5|nr:DEAD/DEAH box helicase [Shimia sp. SK013]KPA22397.1 ATP-dependent RNA helicase RhlE [Shimia sp. SK013]